MQGLKGKRTIWIVVAIVIVAIVGGLIVQRMALTSQPSSYQDRLNKIESQGYSPQQAAWIATSNVTVVSSNTSNADMIVNIPSNVTAEVIIDISPNQTFTPTQSEIDNNTNGIYNMTFSYGNTSFGQELSLNYFLAISSLSTATVVPAAILFGPMEQNVLSISNYETFPSQSLSQEPRFTLLNGGGGSSHNVFHVLEQIKVGLNSLKAISEAIAINGEYTNWLKQLNELQNCAENPTNPLTISGYQQDPGQEQRILDQIASARAQLAELTIARFVNLAVGLGSELVKNLGMDIVALIAEHYSEDTLKQLSEEQFQSIEKLVTPCGTTTTASSMTTQTLRTVTLSTYTPTGSAREDFYGNFQWKLDAGSGYVETASGSFSFSINPSNYSITGSGKGFVTDNLGSPSPCSASGSGSYSFTVNGSLLTNDNTLRLQFGNANPPTVSAPEYCSNLVETATWGTGTGIQPSVVIIAAADGATVQCPSTCLGSQLTYQITIHSGQATSTQSSQTTTETSSASTSSITSSETSSETSSSSSGTTLKISTSNSTSTS